MHDHSGVPDATATRAPFVPAGDQPRLLLQPIGSPDALGIEPYPYWTDHTGRVGRQDVWKGRPFQLIGVQPDLDDPGNADSVILVEQVWADPRLASDTYPVFVHLSGPDATPGEDWNPLAEPFYTYRQRIGSARIVHIPSAPDPASPDHDSGSGIRQAPESSADAGGQRAEIDRLAELGRLLDRGTHVRRDERYLVVLAASFAEDDPYCEVAGPVTAAAALREFLAVNDDKLVLVVFDQHERTTHFVEQGEFDSL
ncbi:hypothetical protein ALI22I_20375 [Saccharothrix sp. ALI-22-I]|uniref:hypothetical protein n=1 Tax=Saccharothrix sp. ALI-22-I TaxID=1933778 RepID=UPI00097C729C|nr:hypothetical protein [Saccharothrix sp. ALI-22-I]ONI88097.1 hypothetical protein ALI22I_20375 [Saccharothrix sp. ALI-22-I]